MPFLSYQLSPQEAVRNAGAFIQQAGADAVKLEGGVRVTAQIEAIAKAGIVVFGHIGLTPQSSGQLGGFKAQGLTADSARTVLADAEAVEEAGAMFLLVEAVAPEVTQIVRDRLRIPVYGIGAGPASGRSERSVRPIWDHVADVGPHRFGGCPVLVPPALWLGCGRHG